MNMTTSTPLTILLDASLRCVLLFALAGVASVLLRKRSAALRHGVWTMAVALALLLPALCAVLPSWRLNVLPETVTGTTSPEPVQPSEPIATPAYQDAAPRGLSETTTTSKLQESKINIARRESLPAASSTEETPAVATNEPNETPNQSSSFASTLRAVPVSVWILLVWAAGVVVMLASLLLGTIGIRRVARRSGHITDPAILSMKDRLCEELAIHQPVLMLQSKESFVPVTWGVWWPTVLLPREAQDWSHARLRMVLLHELAHIKRGDCLTQLLVQLARAMYWFHPLIWWAAKNLRIQRERACDDLVLTAGVAGPDYADQLLQIVRSLRSGRGTPLAAVAMARKSQFESRLLSVLDTARQRSGLTRKVAWAILAVALAVALPLAAVQPVAKAKDSGTTAANETKTDQKDQMRHFVLLVAGPDGMTFEGKKITWEQLPALLKKVPTRKHTVFEIAVTSDELPVKFKRQLMSKANRLVKQYGFEYLSDTGIKPLGTKGDDPEKITSHVAKDNISKDELIGWVEKFFSRNYRDITARKTLQWGQPEKTDDGNVSIRYKFLATIWHKEKMVIEKRFIFTPEGKYVSAETIEKTPVEDDDKSETKNKCAAGEFPVVVKTNPIAFRRDVDPKLKEITVTFDQPMMDGSWSWTGGGKTYPKVTGKIFYDQAKKTCTLPVKLQPGKVYWVGINSPSHKNFKTMDRKPAKWHAILFATKSKDGKPTPIPEKMLRQARQINGSKEKEPEMPSAPEDPSRKLLDAQTRKDVAKCDRMFAGWFRPNSRYEMASDARKALMVKQWIKDAQSDNFNKRTKAIAMLGNVKAESAVDALIEIAEEPMNNCRPKWLAVRALGEIGDRKAVPTLIGLVDHGNWNTRIYARASLAKITGVYFGDDKDKWIQWWKQHAPEDTAADQEQSEALSQKAWGLWRQRKLTDAEKLFKQAVELDPKNTNALNGLGWSQFNQGKPINARRAFLKCIALEPKHAAALNGLGWIAKGQKKTKQAIEYWTKAVEAAPVATAALSGLTQTYMEQKKYDDAIKYFQMWLKVEPNNAGAKKGLKEAQKAGKANPADKKKEETQAIKSATKEALRWLKNIDTGKYGQSWEEMAEIAKSAVSKEQWIQAADPLKALGRFKSRKRISVDYTTTLPGAPDGQYVILKYQAVYEKKAKASETVTLVKEKDHQWRVSGCFVN